MFSDPSDFDKELTLLRERISIRLNYAASDIIREEVGKILGRVKIISSISLNGKYEWFIETEKKDET